MKITVLGSGTSTGIPVITCKCDVCVSSEPKDKRLRASIMIEIAGKTIVIDTGPDFRAQMLNAQVKDLDAILFTHSHKDHVGGLDDVRPFNYFNNKSIPIYAEDYVIAALEREMPYAFNKKDPYPGVPKLEINTISNKVFEIFGIPIIPIRAMHSKLPVLGFRIGNFTYLTDAGSIEEIEIEKIKGTQIFVINGIQWAPHYSHFNVEQAIEIINKVNPKIAYLTHISHKLGMHKVVEAQLPENIRLAYDGLQMEI
jgi:phosphoribosyl 1,2-cyclic phosphate phosphodiesterase